MKSTITLTLVALIISVTVIPSMAECQTDRSDGTVEKKNTLQERLRRLETVLEGIEVLLKYDLDGVFKRIQQVDRRLEEMDKRLRELKDRKNAIRAKRREQLAQVNKDYPYDTESKQRRLKEVEDEYNRQNRIADALLAFYNEERRKVEITRRALQQEWLEASRRFPERVRRLEERFKAGDSKSGQSKEGTREELPTLRDKPKQPERVEGEF